MEAKHSTMCHMRPLKSPDIFKDRDRVFAVLPHPRDASYVFRRNNDGAVLSPTAGSVLYPFRAVRESSTVQRPNPNEALGAGGEGGGEWDRRQAKKGTGEASPRLPRVAKERDARQRGWLWPRGVGDDAAAAYWSSVLFRSGPSPPFLPTSIHGRQHGWHCVVCTNHEPTQRHTHQPAALP